MTQIPKGWRRSKLSDCATIERGRFSHRPRNAPEFYGGNVPFVQTGDVSNSAGVIVTFSQTLNDRGLAISKLFPKGTLLMTIAANIGDIAELGFDSACPDSLVAISPKEDVENGYLRRYLEFLRPHIHYLAPQNAQKNISVEFLNPLPVLLPPLPEQRKIAVILSVWDQVIQKTQAMVKAKGTRLDSLRQQLLIGTCRFTDFKKTRRHTVCLDEVAENVSERNAGQFTDERLYAVTKAEGIVPMRERVKGLNHERCKIVAKDWFAYNPMRLNIGSISRWEQKQPVMVSGDYVVFRCKESQLLPEYLDHVRRSSRWTSFVKAAGNGSVRVRIYFDDLGRFSFSLPSIEEQRRIATVLNACEREINLLEAELKALKEQKRGLMEELLTGKVRVKP